MRFFIALFLFFEVFQVFGQIKNHVNWNIETQKKSNNEYVLLFKAKPEKDWHFYSINDKLNPLIFNFKKSENYSLKGKIQENPKAKTEYDEIMESERSYHEKEALYSQLITVKTTNPFTIEGSIEYQACYLDGMCVMEEYDFKIPIQNSSETTAQQDTTQPLLNDSLSTQTDNKTDVSDISNPISQISPITTKQEEGTLWWLFIFSFLAGLAAILTPCVFPMIPMTVSFFYAQR